MKGNGRKEGKAGRAVLSLQVRQRDRILGKRSLTGVLCWTETAGSFTAVFLGLWLEATLRKLSPLFISTA